MCQNVIIMAIFNQSFTSFDHISNTYPPTLVIFGTVMKYHRALLIIKKNCLCQIMLIITISRNSQQHLQHPWTDFVHILYSHEVQWRFDVYQIDFAFVPRCPNDMYAHFHFAVSHLCVIAQRSID
jgi:hypothetical protein